MIVVTWLLVVSDWWILNAMSYIMNLEMFDNALHSRLYNLQCRILFFKMFNSFDWKGNPAIKYPCMMSLIQDL